MPVPRRLTYPDTDCACAVACGVKPEPPLAVAARGLTPHATAKPRSGSDLARATIFCGSNTRAAPHDPIAQGANRTDGNLVRTRTRTLRSVIARSARRNAGNLVRVTHRGQRSFQTAQTGRIHERSRPLRRHRFCCLPNGGRPYMTGGVSLLRRYCCALRAQHEATIPFRGDLVTDLPIAADAASIRHEDLRLAGDVDAHVPGIR